MAGRKLSDFGKLSDAEQQLVAACKAGEPCELGDGTRPDGPSPERSIRASLLRYLILGGGPDCIVHEMGVVLVGAHIAEDLDLSFATVRGPTLLIRCTFDHEISALQTRFEFLNLVGSSCPGLNAQGAQVTGGVFLNGGFKSTGEVILAGAIIGGQLNCRKGTFENEQGLALNAEGAQVTGDVGLHDGYRAKGEVSLSGAKIGGQLNCSGGTFENEKGYALDAQGAQVTGAVFLDDGFRAKGQVTFSGATIGGQLTCRKGTFENKTGHALNAQRLKVTGELIWQNVATPAGLIAFNSAKVGTLADKLDSWPRSENGERLFLDGMTYDRLGPYFQNVSDRLDWLARGTIWNGNFYPQPYTQLAKVYREMGHYTDEQRVLFTLEKKKRAHFRLRMLRGKGDVPLTGFSAFLRKASLVKHYLLDLTQRFAIGYGHRPYNLLVIMPLLFVLGFGLTQQAWNTGAMAPNSDVVLTSEPWSELLKIDCVGPLPRRYVQACVVNPAKEWSDNPNTGMDWESFSSFGYALDLAIPVLDLGQTDAWAPSKDRGFWGWALWWVRWPIQLLGWVATLLGAAVITGIIKRE